MLSDDQNELLERVVEALENTASNTSEVAFAVNTAGPSGLSERLLELKVLLSIRQLGFDVPPDVTHALVNLAGLELAGAATMAKASLAVEARVAAKADQ